MIVNGKREPIGGWGREHVEPAPAAPAAPRPTGHRLVRVGLLTVTGVFLVMAAWELTLLVPLMKDAVGWGAHSDFGFYRSIGERWLATGQYYLPEQLVGPYPFVNDTVVLYPPIALYLFVPFVFLPGFLWTLIPASVVVYALNRWRPAMWTWPFLAFAVFWHEDLNDVLQGSNVWFVGAVAGGLLWGWPSMLIFLKPGWLPFAVLGIWKRGWWVGLAVVVLLSLPMLPLWFDYVKALGNLQGISWYKSWGVWPMMVAPLVAWLGRTRYRETGC